MGLVCILYSQASSNLVSTEMVCYFYWSLYYAHGQVSILLSRQGYQMTRHACLDRCSHNTTNMSTLYGKKPNICYQKLNCCKFVHEWPSERPTELTSKAVLCGNCYCTVGFVFCRTLSLILLSTVTGSPIQIQSTLALRTPRYYGHPDNTDSG